LPATGLIQPGSIVEYRMRAVLPPGMNADRVIRDLRSAFHEQGWRVRNARDAAPGVGQFVDRTSVFMTLVGLTSLLVGGIGVANGGRAWLDAAGRSAGMPARLAGSPRAVAILRCLGASARMVFAVVMIQVMVLSALGVAIGLVAGAVLPVLAGI